MTVQKQRNLEMQMSMLASCVEEISTIHGGQNIELQNQIESLRQTFEYN